MGFFELYFSGNSFKEVFVEHYDVDQVPMPKLQSPDAKRVYLYEWDDDQQKVVGKWVDVESK